MQIYLPIAELSLNAFLLLGIGLAIGFLSGMFGIGGGFIMTPLLIFLGVPAGVAVGTGASQVMASSVSSAFGHWQRGNIDLQMGYLLIGGGIFGAVTGVKILYRPEAGGPARFLRLAHLRDPARRDRLPDADREPAHAERGAGAGGWLGPPGRPAHVDPGPAAQAAVSRLQALHQRHPAGRHRRLRRLAHRHHGRRRRLRHGAGHDLSAAHADPHGDRHLGLPDRRRDGRHHRAAVGAEPRRRRGAGAAADRRRRGGRAVRRGLRASGSGPSSCAPAWRCWCWRWPCAWRSGWWCRPRTCTPSRRPLWSDGGQTVRGDQIPRAKMCYPRSGR